MRIRSRWASSSLPVLFEIGQRLLKLCLDALDRPRHTLLAGGVVRSGKHHELLERVDPLPGERIDDDDRFYLVAEKLDADDVLLIRGMNLDAVAAHAEVAAHQVHIVAVVLHIDQLAKDAPLLVLFAAPNDEQLLLVLLGRPEAVDARHRCDDDGVSTRQQRGC